LSITLVAAYACEAYGAGSYGTCSAVGAPNTGFAPLAMLHSLVTNQYFITSLLISMLIMVGLLLLLLAGLRRK